MKTPKNGDETPCAEDGGWIEKNSGIDGWFALKFFSGKRMIDDTNSNPLTLPIYNIDIFFGIM